MAKHRYPKRSALTPQARRKSLQDLDGQDWGDPTYPSHVVITVHRLRRVPLQDLTVEDVRFLIGQDMSESLPYLVPLAVERLQENPLVSGAFYPGDLLKNVVRIGAPFWKQHPDLRRAVDALADQALALLADVDGVAPFLAKDITGAIEHFKHASRP